MGEYFLGGNAQLCSTAEPQLTGRMLSISSSTTNVRVASSATGAT